MRHYIQMPTQFVRSINLFLVPDQTVGEDNTIANERFDVVENFPLPLID